MFLNRTIYVKWKLLDKEIVSDDNGNEYLAARLVQDTWQKKTIAKATLKASKHQR